jgi:hypothetical protein
MQWSLSESVRVCSSLSESVQGCPSLSESIRVCPSLSESVRVCPNLSDRQRVECGSWLGKSVRCSGGRKLHFEEINNNLCNLPIKLRRSTEGCIVSGVHTFSAETAGNLKGAAQTKVLFHDVRNLISNIRNMAVILLIWT